jgi:predicted transcriptional regulator
VAECEQNKDTILVEVQSKPILNVLEREVMVMEESGLVSREAGKRKVSITPKGIKRLIEISILEGCG